MMNREKHTVLALRRALHRQLSHRTADQDGWTDLHYTAALDLEGGARALLDRGANVNARLKEDRLHVGRAAEIMHTFGIPFTSWQREGDTPLHLAAWTNGRATAEVLLEHGAEVNAGLCLKTRPLHLAAWYDAKETAAVLLSHGADLHPKDWAEWSPLHHAVWRGSVATAEFLLDQGADIEAKAADDWTPLHVATLDDAARAAELLLARGADVNALAAAYQITPLDMAETLNAHKTAAVLRAYGGDITAEEEHEFVGMAVKRLTPQWGVARAFFRRRLTRRAPRGRRCEQ